MVRACNDILAMLKGLQLVRDAVCSEYRVVCKHLWIGSTVKELLKQSEGKNLKPVSAYPIVKMSLLEIFEDYCEKTCAVVNGVNQLALWKGFTVKHQLTVSNAQNKNVNSRQLVQSYNDRGDSMFGHIEGSNLDISSITLNELEYILSKKRKDKEIILRTPNTDSKTLLEAIARSTSFTPLNNIKGYQKTNKDYEQIVATPISETDSINRELVFQRDAPSVSILAKQRRVPSSRLERLISFSGLFAGLGVGTINELTKGAFGIGGSKNISEALFSHSNAEKIVDTLCKVRGAALKIGQILSIQDSSVVSPKLAKAFERVRQAADYMPDWQLENVLCTNLGNNWRANIESFDDKPFAAASIGQVHRAKLKNGTVVAIKVQYPGVAESIHSDIDNLVGILKLWKVFPNGFFIDNIVNVAKRELFWEVDYTREAQYTEKFKEMIASYKEYYVPSVVRYLTTRNVLTTEFVPGLSVDKCFDASYDHREHIGESILKLCLRELFEFQCMQTDPNWSNFLYDIDSKRIMLIDFGSTRFYQKEFIRNYRNIIISAVNNNREEVLEISRGMGFLTGFETKQMEEAHVDAVMILGEMFRCDGKFDFEKQNTTKRIAHLVPTMVAYRLCPPPEEIYSIHRKLSGIFLLCTRLKVKLHCRPLFDEIVVGKFKD